MTEFDEDNGNQYGNYQDDETQGDGLVRIQWRQGDIKQGTPGYFYLARKDTPDGFKPDSDRWQPCKEFFEESSTREEGWKAELLQVAIICARAQPYKRPVKNSGLPKVWYDTWPKGESDIAMHADVLLIADGLQELGPVKWATNATTTAFAVVGKADPKKDPQGGILHRIREEILGPADKAAKVAYRKSKKLYWLFWVTIGSQRDAKGDVVFTPTKAKAVTKPALILPPVVDTAWLKANFVGGEMAQYGEELRRMYDDWRLTKRTNDAPEPVKTGRNVPQPVGVGDDEAPDF